MRKDERKWMVRLAYFTPCIGIAIGGAYLLIEKFFGLSLVFVNAQGVATIVAGFSFTMLGFLAAIAAFMFSLQKYIFFRRWINDGGADVFFVLYRVAIICLFVTFSLSLIVFTKVGSSLAFKLMLMFALNNVIQTMILALVISGKVALAKKEDS
ncbi:hypothetical protein [Kosakonia cowanii]|uniref:hypothetical protein n=1 Tax=Kosakonia cowanii TaxID=208223 RepID=UPI0028A72856|nr:hypothetical protein [Kosakonia cowanii]